MAESRVREGLKQGMKLWIVTSERVRSKVTEMREDFEDLVVEARQEYERRADARAQTDANSEAAARVAAPRPKATRTQAKRGERAKPSDEAKAAKEEQTAKAV